MSRFLHVKENQLLMGNTRILLTVVIGSLQQLYSAHKECDVIHTC